MNGHNAKSCICADCCAARKERRPRTFKALEAAQAKKRASTPAIVVKKYTGEKALQKGLNEMAQRGYESKNQATRKALYSAAAGVATRKQIHTVTFVKVSD